MDYSGGFFDLAAYGFTEGFYFYGFENATTETFTMYFDDGTSAYYTATSGTCDQEGCADGYVEDCSGDGDCCLESWIGDGYPDCEDQQYGCDLTCYDNDGGDCDGRSIGTNDLVNSQFVLSLIHI